MSLYCKHATYHSLPILPLAPSSVSPNHPHPSYGNPHPPYHPPQPHTNSRPSSHFPHGQHLPLAIVSAGTLIVVEGLHVTDGASEEVLGGLSIEAEQLKRSAEGTWYTIFSSHTHQPRGQVLLASQYMPLAAAYNNTKQRTAAPPGGAPAASAAAGAGEASGVDPVYHTPQVGGAGGGAVVEGAVQPPAYDSTISGGGVVRMGGEGEANARDDEIMSRFNSLK